MFVEWNGRHIFHSFVNETMTILIKSTFLFNSVSMISSQWRMKRKMKPLRFTSFLKLCNILKAFLWIRVVQIVWCILIKHGDQSQPQALHWCIVTFTAGKTMISKTKANFCLFIATYFKTVYIGLKGKGAFPMDQHGIRKPFKLINKHLKKLNRLKRAHWVDIN